ncbi:MAG: hypothetical protein K8S25_05975 [Alphaproteobacteria bacterium]|nr:hypothetical protein [Alphaproteobacteria bacterium]
MAGSLAVMGIAGSAAVLMGWLPSWPALTQDTIAVAEVLPYMQAIKENEPLLYERIETSVIRDQLDGVPADRVRANAKALVQSYVADKTKLLPDQLTYELYVLTRDQLAYLGERQEFETCKTLALGRTNEDLDGKLSAELVERANSSIARVVATKANAETVKMPAEEFSQFASHAFGEALQTTGIPADEIDAILAGSGDAAKTCKLMKAFFDAILSQPIGVAASALRSLADGERAQTR